VPSPEAVAAAVARNTRRLRTARGWSLDHLASRSGVSKGMLVHLEQARTNPSLGTLCKIAETLGVSLAGLVELHEAPAVRVVLPTEVVRLWSSDSGSSGDLLVGSDEREHVVAGTLTLEVDGTAHVVPAGGAALFQSDRPHAYGNAGDRTARLVMVVLQPDADLDLWTVAREAGGERSSHDGERQGSPT
jgi:transcriptional regulator with XRE-family HTH domain